MKRYVLFFSLLIVTISLSAQSVLSFGARGGLEFMMPKTDQTARSKTGLAGVFDIGYTYYWQTPSGYWGLHSGVSAGYAKNECQIDLKQQYTVYDADNDKIEYTVKGEVSTKLQRAYIEVPLMAAFRTHGVILQFGLKGQYAFWSTAAQTISDSYIDAYFPNLGVHVTNKSITGAMGEDLKKEMEFSGNAPAFSLLAAMRVGYEAKMRNSGRLGVIAYLDCNFWNTGTGSRNSDTPLISVTPPTGASDAVVSVNNAFTTVIARINPIQVGLSLYYAIEFMPRNQYPESLLETRPLR